MHNISQYFMRGLGVLFLVVVVVWVFGGVFVCLFVVVGLFLCCCCCFVLFVLGGRVSLFRILYFLIQHTFRPACGRFIDLVLSKINDRQFTIYRFVVVHVHSGLISISAIKTINSGVWSLYVLFPRSRGLTPV